MSDNEDEDATHNDEQPKRVRDRLATIRVPYKGPEGSIIFSYHYKYESGREGDWFLTGFSPRVQSLTLYIMPGFSQYEGLMARLGKYKTGKSCLYIKRLGDVDLAVLKDLVQKSADYIDQKYNS